jgi:hypothetical protein
MKKYIVKTTCTFERKYLEAGKVVEYPDDVAVPRHLILAENTAEVQKPKSSEDTMSGLAKKQVDAMKPKTGFGAGLSNGEPKKVSKFSKSKNEK